MKAITLYHSVNLFLFFFTSFSLLLRKTFSEGEGTFSLGSCKQNRSWRIRFTTMLPSMVFVGLTALIGMSWGSYPFPHALRPHLHPRLYHGCYGDIMTMETSGVRCDISNLLSCGIQGSEMFADMDLNAIRIYQTLIKEVGQRYCVDPALIAAVISRESHGGAVLQHGWDHRGLKFGLMQLDKSVHPTGAWDSKEHLSQGVGILAENIKVIQRKFPMWSMDQHLKGGLSAFKSGTEAIAAPEDIDSDYVNDVIARARFYKSHGF